MSRFKVSAGVIATLAFVGQVSAGFMDITGGFNVLTFGNFTSSNDEIWGTLGVSGNVEIKNSYSIGTHWANTGNYPTNAIVAGGDVILNGSGSVWGGVSAGESVSVSAGQNVHGAIGEKVLVKNLFNFDEAKTQLEQLSNVYAANVENVAAEVKYGGVFFKGINEDVNYFTMDAEDFANVSYLQFDIAKDSKAVITVKGKDVSFVPTWGGNFGVNGLGGDGGKAYSGNVLWNFVDANTLKVGGSIGTILGVNANVELVGGEIWGDLITGSAKGSSQMHLAHFGGDVPSNDVPEASTVAMVLVGLFCLLVISKKNYSLS